MLHLHAAGAFSGPIPDVQFSYLKSGAAYLAQAASFSSAAPCSASVGPKSAGQNQTFQVSKSVPQNSTAVSNTGSVPLDCHRSSQGGHGSKLPEMTLDLCLSSQRMELPASCNGGLLTPPCSPLDCPNPMDIPQSTADKYLHNYPRTCGRRRFYGNMTL